MILRLLTRNLIPILLVFIFNTHIAAQDSPSLSSPKLGYALSGGGAKGLAHVGVLEVLEANGIMPDYISGTSMGSIVGSLYAIGYTPQEIIGLATSLDWEYYFSDSYPRTYLPIEERNKADRYQLSFAIKNGGLVIPKGLIGGRKILNLLGGTTAPVHTIGQFEQFYIPFSCVATDLETGEAYVFTEGSLRHAIRASMSIPSAFEPLLRDSHLLVDGMLARNLPVKDAFDLGANIVIGVDVGSPLYKSDELNSVLKVLEQTSSYQMVNSTLEQRALADMLIDPDLTGYSSLSYDSADTIIARGRQAALAALPQLKHQLDSLGWEPKSIRKRPTLRKDSFYIKGLSFQGDNNTTQRTLQQLVKIKTPSIVTIEDLSKLTGLLYSSGFFSMVDYELDHHEEGGGYQLKFSANGTPNFHVKISANYDTDFNAGLLLNLTARNQLINGSLFSTDIRISEHPGLWVDYLIYTRTQPSVGIQLNASAQVIPGKIYEQKELVDEFTFHHYQLGLHLQASLSRQWHAKAGIEGQHFSNNPRFFTLDDEETYLNQWSILAQLIRDTYDRSYFPKDGSLTHLWAQLGLAGKITDLEDIENSYSTTGDVLIAGNLHKAFSVSSRWWLDLSLGAGASKTRYDHLLQRFYLGRQAPESPRFFEVYGFQQTELMPTAFGYGRLNLRTQVGGSNYLGLGYNYGKWMIHSEDEPDQEGIISGLGLEIGSMTPFGPIRFTAEYNLEFDRFNYSLFGGYRF